MSKALHRTGHMPYASLIVGRVTRQNGNDRDEWFVEDDTGEIVVDFRSDHIPSIGTDVIVWGSARQNEIDEIAWCPLAKNIEKIARALDLSAGALLRKAERSPRR